MAQNEGISNGANKVNILGVNINNLTKKQALIKIEGFIDSQRQYYLVTVNPEIILAVHHDEELFYILNKADLALSDGVGIKIAGWLIGKNLSRITGADLVKDMLLLAQKQGRSVAVFNWRDSLSNKQDIRRALADKYPGLRALVIDIERQTAISPDKLAQAKDFKPEIIFCALGAPYQEKFIFHNLAEMPSVKIGAGVGGSFDFITGKLKRAPKFLRNFGLEWLWRLINQPRRLSRIYKAVIVFSYKFILWRFILPHLYRKNVACLLFKREENDKYKILIVERADAPGHWQLPQGGVDGQDFISAGKRELSEEINTDKFKPLAVFAKLHQYEFGNIMSQFLAPLKKVRGYKGQKQGLFIAEFNGTNNDIKVNFWEHSSWRWVDADKLVETVHPVRQGAAKIFMEKFWQFVKK